MTRDRQQRAAHVRPMPIVLREALVVLAVSLVLGGLTSPAQTYLPDAVSSFANSSSGWTLLTASIIFATRERRALPTAILGAVSFIALVAGYVAVSTLRGFPDTEALFFTIAVLAGPIVGLCAGWLHRRDLAAALGTSVLAGIGLGDGAFGLLVNSSTASWVYWTLIATSALALIAFVTNQRLTDIRHRATAAIGAPVCAAAFYLASSSLS